MRRAWPGSAPASSPGSSAHYRTVVESSVVRSFLADTRPLQEPHFRRLWTANIVTVIGAQLTVVAVPAQIYAETGSSAYVGLTGVFGVPPPFFFALHRRAPPAAFHPP